MEYKSILPSSPKIARSIASFANSHGGTILYGVKANQTNKPEALPGIDPALHPSEKLHQIAFQKIDPMPRFQGRLVEVDGGNVILLAHVPESFTGPHFVEGLIHVRNGNQSDPIPLERYDLIERLYRKSASASAEVRATLTRLWDAGDDSITHEPFQRYYAQRVLAVPYAQEEIAEIFSTGSLNALQTVADKLKFEHRIVLQSKVLFGSKNRSDQRFSIQSNGAVTLRKFYWVDGVDRRGKSFYSVQRHKLIENIKMMLAQVAEILSVSPALTSGRLRIGLELQGLEKPTTLQVQSTWQEGCPSATTAKVRVEVDALYEHLTDDTLLKEVWTKAMRDFGLPWDELPEQ